MPSIEAAPKPKRLIPNYRKDGKLNLCGGRPADGIPTWEQINEVITAIHHMQTKVIKECLDTLKTQILQEVMGKFASSERVVDVIADVSKLKQQSSGTAKHLAAIERKIADTRR